MKPNSIPHLRGIDLRNTGVVDEVLVMKEDRRNGDIYYIAVSDLDDIDKARIRKILAKRDAHRVSLPELMASETLRNGMNALEFFHQLVKIRTMSGKILPVGSGKRGLGAVAPPSQYSELSEEKRPVGRPKGS